MLITVFKSYIFKTPNWHKNGREIQDQEESAFYKYNMCNNTIKITLQHTQKTAKGITNIINAVDGQRIANNFDSQIQGQTNFRSTFVMLK